MWFKLEATSCMDNTDVLKKYCEELSTFNIRILHVPGLFFSNRALLIDELVLIELNSLEDFVRLGDSLDRPLILREREKDGIRIEIYDDWRE